MAVKLFEKYGPDRANAPTSLFPQGSLKNESVPGANDGTPLDKDWGNDYAGFDAALFAASNITPSGNVDTALASQRLEALRKITTGSHSILSDMIADETLTVGQFILLKGRNNPGDGGHNLYEIVSSGTGTDDGGSFIDLTGSGHQAKGLFPDGIHVEQFGAIPTAGLTGSTVDTSSEWQAAINFAAGDIVNFGVGTWLLEGRVNCPSGTTVKGKSDWTSVIYFGGSDGGFQVGPNTIGPVESQITFSDFNVRTTGTSTLSNIFKITIAFQVYFERVRVYRMQRMCSDAIIDLDGLGAEAPVRVVIRDCYVDAAQYDTTDDGLNTPTFVWNRGGIQLIFDNTHIQSINRAAILGVDPNNPGYLDNFCEDTFFLNNSRFQIGTLGNIDQDATAFECYEGGNLVIDNSTIFLNNYGQTQLPGNLNLNTAVKLKDTTGGATAQWQNVNVTNTRIFGNARTDRYFNIETGATFNRFFHDKNTYVQTKPDLNILVNNGSGTVYEGENGNTNSNSWNGLDVIGNFKGGTPVSLDNSKTLVIRPNDGGTRIFNQLSGGVVGVPYLIRFDPINNSVINLRFAAGGTSNGFIFGDGSVAGRTFSVGSNDALIVWKNNSDTLSAGAYYGVLIRDGQEIVPNGIDTGSLNDVTNPINTNNKLTGKMEFNTTVDRPVWSTGDNPTDVWVYADGTTANTPV